MNSILLRYLGFVLVALLAGAGGGMLVANKRQANPPSGTTVAIPAQPFPGQGIRAIPAAPAQPAKEEPNTKSPTIVYVDGAPGSGAGHNQMINDKDVAAYPAIMYGTNFSFQGKGNDIYWDGKLIVENDTNVYDASYMGPGVQQLNFDLPMSNPKPVGSYHSIYIKNHRGQSNTVQVQVVENITAVPHLKSFNPDKGPIGTKIKVITTKIVSDAPPLSIKTYADLWIPASAIKSGEGGLARVWIPMNKVSSSDTEDTYSITLLKQAVYCPSWGYDKCTLAPADTTVTVPVGGPYEVDLYFFYTFQYRGAYHSEIGGLQYWLDPEYYETLGTPPPLLQFTITP